MQNLIWHKCIIKYKLHRISVVIRNLLTLYHSKFLLFKHILHSFRIIIRLCLGLGSRNSVSYNHQIISPKRRRTNSINCGNETWNYWKTWKCLKCVYISENIRYREINNYEYWKRWNLKKIFFFFFFLISTF